MILIAEKGDTDCRGRWYRQQRKMTLTAEEGVTDCKER
jgi:hypothetical protein